MAEDVQITIGASIENLTAALSEATGKLQGFGAAFEELKGALALGGLTEFVSKMAELGEEAARSAAMLGISTESAQELGLIAQASGGSLQSITSQLVRLQVGLERGSKETSVQAAAFRALGIDIKTFINTPVDKQMNLFADAVKKVSDEGKNAAPALALISRGLAQMMPELEQGSAHLEEFKQKSIDAGAIVSGQTTRAMDTLNGELIILWGSLKALGQVLAEALSPQITQFAHEIEQATLRLSAQLVTGTFLSNLWTEFTLRLQRSIAFLSGNSEEVKKLDKALDDLNHTIDETIKKYTAMLKAAADALGKTPVNVKMPGADRDQMKLAEENYREQSEQIQLLAKTFQITENEKTEMFRAALERRMNAEIAAGENSLVAQRKFAADYTKITNQLVESQFAAWKNLADTIASDFSSALDSVLTKQKTFSQAMGEMFGKMIEKMLADLIKLIAEYAILKAVAGTALAPGISAPSFGALAQGTFPILGSLLGGGAGAAGGVAQTAALTANTGALTALTTAVTGHAVVTTGQTAATTAQTGAAVANTAATFEGTAVTTLHTAVVAPNTVATVANTFATELNTIKGFFPGFATGAWEIGRNHSFPSYAQGTPFVPGGQLAVLHAGEMVIPAAPAAAIRAGGAAGGGMNVSLSISALDASGFASWLRGGGGNMLSRYLSQQWQNNPSMRPGFAQ